MSIASTNARSIAPKIISLKENFAELDLCMFAITETWLGNSAEVKQGIKDLADSSGIEMLCKNRKSRGGGVALAYNTNLAKLKSIQLPGNNFELLCCGGKIVGLQRAFVVFVCYLPPKMSAGVLDAFCNTLSDGIELVKDKYDDPFIIITGDFNKKSIGPALCDFPDVQLVPPVPTRGSACLDLTFSNLGQYIADVRSLPALESNDGLSTSDHSIVTIHCKIPKLAHFVKKRITFRPFTTRGEVEFGRGLLNIDWRCVENPCPSQSAELLRSVLDKLMNECFPTKTRVIKSTDSPWMTREVYLLSRRKKREYARKRRSPRWKMLDRLCQAATEKAKTCFFENVKNEVKTSGNSAGFFKAVKRLAQGDQKSTEWSINDMFPGNTDDQIAENVATFFNKISCEYEPLQPTPVTFDFESSICPALHQVAASLKSFKKPRSIVDGDIFRQLVTKYADVLAIPLHHVYKRSFARGIWPELWKRETVVVIPKCSKPSSLSELRNLSCTPLFSKVMESFILERLKSEVPLSHTQFGGIRGSSVNHFLIETWDNILTSLEDNRAAAVVSSIDFEKAFNRVCHNQCLMSATVLGASAETVRMLRAFLTGRTMSVKISGTLSTPKPVNGGAPQGSLLGGYLFCMVIERLIANTNLLANSSTLSLGENGIDVTNNSTDSDDYSPPSPIAPPLSPTNLEPDDYVSDDDGMLATCFNAAPINRINDTEISYIASQSAIFREVGRPDRWQDKELEVKIYVDDLNVLEKACQENSISHISTNRRQLRVHAPKVEDFFERVFVAAAEMNMRVNQKKTQVLCMSAAVNDYVSAYIRPLVNNSVVETTSSDSLKIVGFTFGNRPNVSLHIQIMCDKFRCKLWGFRKLKSSGMSQKDLLTVYTSVLRPIIEFASPTYGPMLTQELANNIEQLQLRAMKIVYGSCVSYRTVLQMTELETLETRRNNAIKKFAIKTAANPRFSNKWFPKNDNVRYNVRCPKQYLELPCKSARLYNSPIFHMRRLLNNS